MAFLGYLPKLKRDLRIASGTHFQKLGYLENEKSFLDEIKNIFHSF